MTSPQSDPYATVVEILQKDYASLSAIIGRIEGYRDVLRGAALTLWSALIGLAVANDSVIPILAAGLLVPALAWADLRLDYEYHVAHARSRELEETVRSYVTWVLEIGQQFEDRARERLDDDLAQYSFGSAFNLASPDVRTIFSHIKTLRRRPGLYLLLEVTLVLGAYLLWP